MGPIAELAAAIAMAGRLDRSFEAVAKLPRRKVIKIQELVP